MQIKWMNKDTLSQQIQSFDQLQKQVQQRYNIQRMDIKSYNKSLCEMCRKAFNFAFINSLQPGDQEIYFCNDTDTVKYRVVAVKDKFTLHFYFVDLQNVWKYIETYFRSRYYQNFNVKISKNNNEPSLEISLDQQGFTIQNKTVVLKQVTGILTGKKQFDPLIDILSKKLASIKRHFIASPFEKMLEAVRVNAMENGNKVQENFSFYIKTEKKEKIWLAFQKKQFTVYYGLHFDDRFQQQLGKIFFSELTDAKKHVQNSPSVIVSESEIPRTLIESFPAEKTEKYNFANGLVSFTIFGTLVKNQRSMATYLATFRNYSYYHIQAWKCYLHARLLRRLDIILKDLQNAKVEPFALT